MHLRALRKDPRLQVRIYTVLAYPANNIVYAYVIPDLHFMANTRATVYAGI